MSNKYDPVSRAKILTEVDGERTRQELLKVQGKFHATCATPYGLTEIERLAILAEEFGEVAKEVSDSLNNGGKFDLKALREELIQVAAVCVAWVEGIDAENPP